MPNVIRKEQKPTSFHLPRNIFPPKTAPCQFFFKKMSVVVVRSAIVAVLKLPTPGPGGGGKSARRGTASQASWDRVLVTLSPGSLVAEGHDPVPLCPGDLFVELRGAAGILASSSALSHVLEVADTRTDRRLVLGFFAPDPGSAAPSPADGAEAWRTAIVDCARGRAAGSGTRVQDQDQDQQRRKPDLQPPAAAAAADGAAPASKSLVTGAPASPWAAVSLRKVDRSATVDAAELATPAGGGRGNSFLVKHRAQTKKVEHRNRVGLEILDTERSYVSSLKALRELFMQPLCAPPGVAGVPVAEALAVFGPLEAICSFHENEVLPALEQRMSNWNVDTVLADIFVRMSPFFRVYTAYTDGYEVAQAHVARWRKSSAFQKWADAASADPRTRGLSLESHLIMPVQRIPRYVLLLTDLLKSTWVHHLDHRALSESVSVMVGWLFFFFFFFFVLGFWV
jgi:hypothetical protein